MTYRLAVAALALLVLTASSGTAQEKKRMAIKRPEAPQSAGDLKMTLLPVPSSPLVAFRVQILAGAVDDPEEQEGLNALTALTVAGGGTAELTYRQVLDRLYPMAATIRAQPDREVTTFVGQVHRDHLQAFYRILSDLLQHPRFDEADFRRNRDLLVAAIETGLRGNDDEELGKESLNTILFSGHPYGRPVIGTVRGLKKITFDDVKAYYRQRYTRGNLRIGLAGGYPSSFVTMVQEDLKRLPDGATPHSALPSPPKSEGIELLMVEKPGPTSAISIGCSIDVIRTDPDYYALLVANSYLGEHRTFNGRLMNIMRGARGLNYGDYSYIETFIQDGGSTFPLTNIPRRQQTFTIWIRPVARDNAAFALREAVRELQRVVEHGLTPSEFEETRRYLLNYSKLYTQSLSRRLGGLLDAQFYATKPLVDRIQEELPKLTVEDVNAALAKHLDPSALKVAIVTEGARGLVQELTSGRTTPIHYQTPTDDATLLKEDEAIASFPLSINAERSRVETAGAMFEF